MLSSTDPQYSSTKEKALKALKYITPLLDKYKFKWVLTGGFASYIHGAKRSITDIDLDIFASKDDEGFKKFLEEILPYSKDGLEHFQDTNYDNYSIEIDIEGQIIDICPTKELMIFSEKENKFISIPFYTKSFKPVIKHFEGLELPLLSIENIIENKDMLKWKRQRDLDDIKKLRNLATK